MYDTWRNNDADEWNKQVLPFHYGMRMRCNHPDLFPMELLESDSEVQGIIEKGLIILSYQNSQDELLVKRGAFERNIYGYRAICLNIGNGSSQTFHHIYDESKHDLMLTFFFDGDGWLYSVYTTKDIVDCASLAKSHGGGGHSKAAGFKVRGLDILRYCD